jgi:S1-C subfamily serine protease
MSRLSASRLALLIGWGQVAVQLILPSGSRAEDNAKGSPGHAPDSGTFSSQAEAITREVRQLFEKCRHAVAKVEALDSRGPLAGTGFFIDSNGTLLTSYTVGGESAEITVLQGTQRYAAKRLTADPRSGVAILKIETQTSFLQPGNSRNLPLASPVVAIGYPMDLQLTPSFGTIGGFDLKYLGRFFGVGHIRANLAVQEGESGAPLLNMAGEAVGLLISRMDSGSASFVLPIEAAQKVHRDYLRYGSLRPGWLGMNVTSMAEATAGSRARVSATIDAGPAHKAGLREGDTLLKIGPHPIREIEDVFNASFYLTAEEDLEVQIVRANQVLDLQITPAARPAREPGFSTAPPSPANPSNSLPSTPPPLLPAPNTGAVRVDFTQ